MVKVGCCGFPVAYKRYMQVFDVVEVQQSFYRRLTDKQVENWKRAADRDFEFVLKAPQCVTHPPNSPTYRRSHLAPDERRKCGGFRLTDTVKREMDDFLKKARILGADLFLFQTPASFKPTEENVARLEEFFSYYRGVGRFAWEPRGKEWTEKLVGEICSKLGLIHATDPFLELPPQTEVIYFRMHGDLRSYRYTYTDEELESLLAIVKGRSGYVFFNNSSMFEDARRFKELVKGEG